MNYRHEHKDHYLLEVPPTIGYLQRDFLGADDILNRMNGPISKRLSLRGMLDKARIVTRRWLSPELSTTEEMTELTRHVLSKGYGFVNMSFHSNSLAAGFSPFVTSQKDERTFYKKIEAYLDFAGELGLIGAPLSRAESLLYGMS
jgi:hypothetical protein